MLANISTTTGGGLVGVEVAMRVGVSVDTGVKGGVWARIGVGGGRILTRMG